MRAGSHEVGGGPHKSRKVGDERSERRIRRRERLRRRQQAVKAERRGRRRNLRTYQQTDGAEPSAERPTAPKAPSNCRRSYNSPTRPGVVVASQAPCPAGRPSISLST